MARVQRRGVGAAGVAAVRLGDRVVLGGQDVAPDGGERGHAAGGQQPGADQHRDAEGGVHRGGYLVGVAAEPGQRGQGGHREQTGRAGGGVVDAAGDPRVADLHRREHRRGQRRDQQDHPAAHHGDGRQDVRPVGGVRADPQHQQHSRRADQRPHGERDPRTDPLAEPAGPGGQRQHQHGDRHQGEPGDQWREAGDDLQLHDQQEEHSAERRVDAEGDQVHRGEQAGGEEAERQHRLLDAALDHDERRAQQQTGRTGHPDLGESPAPAAVSA